MIISIRFIPKFNSPFLDFGTTWSAQQISMFSDASKGVDHGFGRIYQNSWVFGQWPKAFIENCNPSIEYLELFGVLVTVTNWLHRYRNKRVVLFCDNQAVVAMINNNTSSCKQCFILIRMLVLLSMELNARVLARYISSK